MVVSLDRPDAAKGKAGAIVSAIGPASGKDGISLSQDSGGCAPTATGHDLGHSCVGNGPGHDGSPKMIYYNFDQKRRIILSI
jgi:hypothetical protein